MNIREARKLAKRLYGKEAFVRIATNGFRDILIDELHIPGVTGKLLGWGSTWEEAFQSARKRTHVQKKNKNKKPRQVQAR